MSGRGVRRGGGFSRGGSRGSGNRGGSGHRGGGRGSFSSRDRDDDDHKKVVGTKRRREVDPKESRGSLEAQLQQDQFVKTREESGKKQRTKGQDRTERRKNKDEDFISNSLSKKILVQAREQLREEEEEEEEEEQQEHFEVERSSSSSSKTKAEESEEEELEEQEEEQEIEDLELDAEDERILELFMPSEKPQTKTLADIILEKIREKELGIDEAEQTLLKKFDPKVVQVYRGVAKVLKTYTSGKIPKAFKIIPTLSNWEEILYLTVPDEWSAPAMFQATRLFASNLNQKMSQRFYSLILFPRIRSDIADNKKLNFHLYQALKKALFKPSAFYKGILLPLCESKTCSLKEAIIIGSVLAKVSIPVLHSAAALLKLAEMEYSGANSLFIRVLLDKKYSLPFRVVDALVAHYLGFATEERKLPVLWHQSLLCFVQRYKSYITKEQREALKLLLRQQNHHQITEEIRRELFNSKARDEEEDDDGTEMTE